MIRMLAKQKQNETKYFHPVKHKLTIRHGGWGKGLNPLTWTTYGNCGASTAGKEKRNVEFSLALLSIID